MAMKKTKVKQHLAERKEKRRLRAAQAEDSDIPKLVKQLLITIHSASNASPKLECAQIKIQGEGACSEFQSITERSCQCLTRKGLQFRSSFTFEQELTSEVTLSYTEEQDGCYRTAPLKVSLIDGNTPDQNCLSYGLIDVSEFISEQCHEAHVEVELEREGGILEADVDLADVVRVAITIARRTNGDHSAPAPHLVRLIPHSLSWDDSSTRPPAQGVLRLEASSGSWEVDPIPTTSQPHRAPNVRAAAGFCWASSRNPRKNEVCMELDLYPQKHTRAAKLPRWSSKRVIISLCDHDTGERLLSSYLDLSDYFSPDPEGGEHPEIDIVLGFKSTSDPSSPAGKLHSSNSSQRATSRGSSGCCSPTSTPTTPMTPCTPSSVRRGSFTDVLLEAAISGVRKFSLNETDVSEEEHKPDAGVFVGTLLLEPMPGAGQ